jgi:glutamate--cysteine ligase
LKQALDLLASPDHLDLLGQGLHGIERETLRVDRQGHLALTPHPIGLGSALTHAEITTDYSESLLEFITPAEHDIATALQELDRIHRYVYSRLDDELLWSQSMPCLLPDEADIPLAWYGNSHIGMLKHVYRRGLALRYGKTMQCIAGVHYNYSLSEDLWPLLQALDGASASAKDYQSERYIALIRNFHRYMWLLMYLFGASPALTSHFLRGKKHQLETLSADTLYLPYATSLRMSDLGYQNDAQADLLPSYESMQAYMRGLVRAVRQPHPPYEALGLKRGNEWVQINTNVLQIENEYYASIRPKRVIRSGERPLEALCSRGVQYVEVRCMDVDPFEPVGISLETSRFLDAFLLFCALDASPPEIDAKDNLANFSLTVKEGRRPGLQLRRNGQAIGLQAWGLELLDSIADMAALLDKQRGDDSHARSLQVQRAKLLDPALTPSARVLQAMQSHGNSFPAFAMQQALKHAQDFKSRPLTADEQAFFDTMARNSLAEQERMEASQTGSFDEFIEDYRSRMPGELCA